MGLRQYENRIAGRLPPFTATSTLRTLLDHLLFLDTFGIFLLSADLTKEQMAAYRKAVPTPICFADMSSKVDADEYTSAAALRCAGRREGRGLHAPCNTACAGRTRSLWEMGSSRNGPTFRRSDRLRPQEGRASDDGQLRALQRRPVVLWHRGTRLAAGCRCGD